MRSVFGIGRRLLSDCYPEVGSDFLAFALDVLLTEDLNGSFQVNGVGGIGIACVCDGDKLSLYHVGSSFTVLYYNCTHKVHTSQGGNGEG